MDRDEAFATLREGDRDARRVAARELWRSTRDPAEIPGDTREAVEPTLENASRVEPALTDDDPVVRGHATAVFGEILSQVHENDEPIPGLDALIERLTDDDERVRQTAIGVLWNRRWWNNRSGFAQGITDAQREQLAVGVVECLHDPVALTRKRASHKLDQFQPSLVRTHPDPEYATGVLVRALDNRNASMIQWHRERVRSNTAAVLSAVATDHPELLEPHVDRLREALDDDAARTDVLVEFAGLDG